MFKVLYEHNSHRELFINGLRKKIDEKLRSGGRAKCVAVLTGSTVYGGTHDRIKTRVF